MIIEKTPGKINICKLRVTLLLEVEFNAIHKIIFNSRLILALEAKKCISCKVVEGRKNQVVIHIALKKKLIENIFN